MELPADDITEINDAKVYETEALLFTSVARVVAAYGFRNLSFDIGGKKARRRFISADAPTGDRVVAWVKGAIPWQRHAEVVRFPWKKLASSPAGHNAVAVACESAHHRGATHLLAVAGDGSAGVLAFARLYPILEVPEIVFQQSTKINSVYYRAHSAVLVLIAHSSEFDAGASLASSSGIDILAPPAPVCPPVPDGVGANELVDGGSTAFRRRRSGNTYRRDEKVRTQVLILAKGHCECCGEPGFLTENGERYLETHHI